MSSSFRIAVIAGDGIGREVIPAGLAALEAATHGADLRLSFTEFPWGCDYYTQHGRMIDADGVRAANPSIRGELVGGLLCRQDAIVEPGHVLGALRTTLEATNRYTWLPRRQVVDVETSARGGAVAIDHTGDRHEGSVAILCIGDRLTGLGGRVGATLAAAPLRRCRLHMMQTAPLDARLTTAVADADSMLKAL